MMWRWPALAGAFLLCSCAPRPLDVGSTTEFERQQGAAIAGWSKRWSAEDSGQDDLSAGQTIDIRSFVYESGRLGDQGGKEFSGAWCVLSLAQSSTSVTTPARVRLPKHDARITPLTVSCTMHGYMERRMTVSASDTNRIPEPTEETKITLVSLLAKITGSGSGSQRASNFVYPNVRVVMRRKDAL